MIYSKKMNKTGLPQYAMPRFSDYSPTPENRKAF
jgi:hypothetical protein